MLVNVLVLLLVLGAAVTIVPRASAKRSMFGRRVLCPFAPVSTLALLVTAAVIWVVGNAV